MVIIIKNKFSIILIISMLVFPFTVFAEQAPQNFDIESPHAVLMDQETGRVLFEKNSKEVCSTASLMKIMNSSPP